LRPIHAQKEEALAEANEKLSALAAEATRRVSSRKEIPALINAAREQLAKLNQQLLVPASPDIPAPLILAQRTLLLAHRQALEQSIAAYEKELASYDATAELLPLEQRVATAQVRLLEQEAAKWRETENRLLAQEAKRQADQARREAIQADPALKPLAQVNRDLAELGEKMAQMTRAASEEQAEVDATLEDVRRQFEWTQNWVDTVGLTNAIGLFMRTRRTALPDASEHYRAIRARQGQIREIQTKLFELQDQRLQLGDLEQQVALKLAEVRSQPTELTPAGLEAAVRELLTKRGKYLDDAIKNYDECLRALVELDGPERQLIDEIEAYSTYIDERVLWIRNADLLQPASFRLAGGIVTSGFSTEGWPVWSEVGEALQRDAFRRPFLAGMALLVFGLWITGQRRLRTWLDESGRAAIQSTQVRIVPTLEALFFTILIAVVWPGLLWYLAWRIASPTESGDFAKSVAVGLAQMAVWWLPLELFRQICRRRGLGVAHFGWPEGSVRVLRRHLRWFVLAGLPLALVAGMMEAQQIERWHNALGRPSFIAMMLLVIVFVHATLRPAGELFRHLLAGGYQGSFYRFRHVVYWLGILAPLGLITAAALGYFYTADQLAARLRETVFLVLGLAVVGALLSRWVFVIRRRLGIQQSRRRFATGQTAPTTAEAPGGAGLPTPDPEMEPDLTAVSTQTRRLLRGFLVLVGVVAVWWIWVGVLPALALLDEVELWSTTVRVAEAVTAADGTGTTTRTTERLEAITLADLGLAALIFLMTVIAAKNVAGLLEISIPRHLPLDAGARYAITTVTRYVVITVGIVLGFGAIGLGWSKVQWLVAALGVGLGFGLQEIFANFVSGLIILFERPIRVGDVVTIGDVSGVVTRIQIRATTVTDWDRKEFIVPNKEFITGQLLNWTRTDHVNRVVINVGIAYGSDTQRARQLLEQAAQDHPEVMEDPAPLVTFESFGDSALDFVLRCYLPRIDNRLRTIHELHVAIDQAFREAGIEIAFPQRDVHIRSQPEPSTKPGEPSDERPAD
jgi:potassium efflux system protein